MRLSVNKSNIPDIISWLLIAYYSLIAQWIWSGRGTIENLIYISVILSVVCVLSFKVTPDRLVLYLFAFLLVTALVWSTLNASTHEYLVQDLKSMAGSFLVYAYLFRFRRLKNDTYKEFMEITRIVLTCYMVINSVIIFLQSRIPYFLMNKSAIASVHNNSYFDQLTGFIGINGTTRWTMLTVLVILMNFHKAFTNSKSASSKKLIIFTVIFSAVSLVIAGINNARAFFILLPLTLLLYYIYSPTLNLKLKIRIVFGTVAGLAVIYIVYLTNGSVNRFINNLITDKYEVYSTFNVDKLLESNDDRAIAVNYAVKYGGLFGRGIGSIPMHSSNNQVKYLGLNSASSFIYMIGSAGYLLYSVFLALIAIGKNKAGKTRYIVYPAYLVIVSYFLPVYSSITLMFTLACILSILCNSKQEETISDENRNSNHLWRIKLRK